MPGLVFNSSQVLGLIAIDYILTSKGIVLITSLCLLTMMRQLNNFHGHTPIIAWNWNWNYTLPNYSKG